MDGRDEAQNDSMRSTLKNLMSECETLMGQLGEEGSRRYRSTLRAFDRQLSQAREDLDDMQYSAMKNARRTMRRADAYVHDKPCRTSPGAAATGILVGAVLVFLLSRR
jgi:ElaB/YqjD/DUF883 family membrane-anchored ribosome-binding protein